MLGMITKTTYIELFGISTTSGEEVYEKITYWHITTPIVSKQSLFFFFFNRQLWDRCHTVTDWSIPFDYKGCTKTTTMTTTSLPVRKCSIQKVLRSNNNTNLITSIFITYRLFSWSHEIDDEAKRWRWERWKMRDDREKEFRDIL